MVVHERTLRNLVVVTGSTVPQVHERYGADVLAKNAQDPARAPVEWPGGLG